MEKQRKENKGITLISLVITIIIMVILAGVTINMALSGNDGIITKANEAVLETRGSAVEERLALWKVAIEVNPDNAPSTEEFVEGLYDEKLITQEERDELSSTGHIQIGSREITIFYSLKLYLPTNMTNLQAFYSLNEGLTWNVFPTEGLFINKFSSDVLLYFVFERWWEQWILGKPRKTI